VPIPGHGCDHASDSDALFIGAWRPLVPREQKKGAGNRSAEEVRSELEAPPAQSALVNESSEQARNARPRLHGRLGSGCRCLVPRGDPRETRHHNRQGHHFRERPKLTPWAQKSVRLKEKAGTGGPARVARPAPGTWLSAKDWVGLMAWSMLVPGRTTLSSHRKV